MNFLNFDNTVGFSTNNTCDGELKELLDRSDHI